MKVYKKWLLKNWYARLWIESFHMMRFLISQKAGYFFKIVDHHNLSKRLSVLFRTRTQWKCLHRKSTVGFWATEQSTKRQWYESCSFGYPRNIAAGRLISLARTSGYNVAPRARGGRFSCRVRRKSTRTSLTSTCSSFWSYTPWVDPKRCSGGSRSCGEYVAATGSPELPCRSWAARRADAGL